MAAQREDIRSSLLNQPPQVLSYDSRVQRVDWLSATGLQIEQHWIERMSANPDARYYLLDMDDTLTETLTRWVSYFVLAHYGKKAFASEYARIMSAKNPFGLLREEFGDETFTKYEQQLRFSRWGNTYGKPVDPNLPEHLAKILERNGEVLGILTARPDDPKVVEHTYEWLHRQQLLHTLPLYHAPTAYTYAQTQEWKVSVFGRLRAAVEEANMTLIDDSVSTAGSVEKWNIDHPDYLPLMQILLCTPLTDKLISEKYDPIRKGQSAGVFIANNWSRVPEAVDEANEWFELVRRSRTQHKRRNTPQVTR